MTLLRTRMKIVAITNIKGGVGKTTTTVNFAHLCAAGGQRVLLWDLDPQGAATYLLRCERTDKVPVRKLVSGKRELNEFVVATGHDRLDILPADFSYRHFDVHLSTRKNPSERLLRMSHSLRDLYDVLFLDCPPGISLLSENVLRAADAVVVPMIPNPLSVRMLVQLRDFLVANAWVDMTLLPFFSMVDRRKALHHQVIAATRREFPGTLETEIPYWSEIERMTLHRGPLAAYAPRSQSADLYMDLWSEVAVKLKQAAFTRAVPLSLPPAAPPASAGEGS